MANRMLTTALMALGLAGALAAQEPTDDLLTETQQPEGDPSSVLLQAEEVEIGGRFRFEAVSAWTYDGLQGPFGAGLTDDALLLDLGAVLFLDSRPSERFRVFAKMDLSFPFDDQGGSRSFDQVFHVTELFSDFQLRDVAFFRAGKQTITWGVGYFFSPADLLNVTEIDPLDAGAELEGPVALKLQLPLGNHNLYLYAVLEDSTSLAQIALAPKLELVIGDSELGLGGFFRAGSVPAAMATLSTSWLDFDLLAEAVLSYGSNRCFAVEDAGAPSGVSAGSYDRGLFPSATAGLRYSYADDRERFKLSLCAQYLYNGESYEEAEFLASHAAGVQALLAAGELSPRDLAGSGRHYGAALVGWSDLLGSDFSLACLWLGNLADGSGMIVPSFTWKVIDELAVTLKAGFGYGEAGEEYAPAGQTMTLSLLASFGGGSF